MRYEFVGKKTPYVGKTLWEIVGNLKNFGVGRLVKDNSKDSGPELSFFKIVKVQPIPPSKKEFEDRSVIIWIDEVFKNRKLGIKSVTKDNCMAKFQLIPKIEEKEYLEKLKQIKPPVMDLPKYCHWPPLYKILWEKKVIDDKDFGPIPKLNCVHPDFPGCTIVEKEEELKTPTCSLYKGELTVEQMYKEIVRLRLLIKGNNTQPEP